jgi:copper resistance protein C
MVQRVLVAALVALGISVMAPVAKAHPVLKASVPAANASAPAPQEIRLTFNEGLIAKLCGAEIKDQSGNLIATGQAAIDPNDKKQLIIPLRSQLSAGHYIVDWHVVSEDTHRVKGSFSFEVQP